MLKPQPGFCLCPAGKWKVGRRDGEVGGGGGKGRGEKAREGLSHKHQQSGYSVADRLTGNVNYVLPKLPATRHTEDLSYKGLNKIAEGSS